MKSYLLTLNSYLLTLLTLSTLSTLLLASCGGPKENPQARALLEEAQRTMEFGDYGMSIELLDSLQSRFPDQTAIGREALALRPKVIELFTERQITTTDSLIAVNEAAAERLRPAMKWVKTPGMIEGYYVEQSAYNPSFLNTTGLQGRVSEIGQFYLVSSLNPGGLKHTSVSLSTGGESAATPAVAYDGDSNFRIGSGEMITFSPEQSDTIGWFAANHPGALSLTFNGSKSRSVKLTPRQTAAIAAAWEYSRALCDVRQLGVERQRLDRTLQTARDQQARTQKIENRE